MFKRKYSDLKNATEGLPNLLGDAYDDRLNKALKRIAELEAELEASIEVWGRKELVVRELSKDVDHYKKLYADELAKRLDLAEKVRNLENSNYTVKEKPNNEHRKIQ